MALKRRVVLIAVEVVLIEVIGIAHHPSRNVIAGFAGDGSMVFMKA